MMERHLAVEISAMELLEAALEQPENERVEFIAGAAQPLRVRRTALRLLRRAGEPDYWPSFSDLAEPERYRLRLRAAE